jgi:glucan 1,3-beta-glucosidase
VNGNGRRHRRIWLCIALAIVAVVAIAIAVPIAVIKHKHNHSAAGQTGSSTAKNAAVTGGDGSTVTTANGTTFTYKNSFGGFWVDDPENPWNNSAQCNSWTKPLTEKWDFVNDKIYGVNLGGWFVLEPFITPAFYQKYNGSVDEWSLSVMMANDTSPGGGLDQIEQHYATFMDETDIARIAGAGLNWVRVPIPFWAIDVWNDEPFLAKKAWPYIVQLLKWCRKYGLRVNLDLHTIPGSQNGYNHSGRLGNIGWMYGIMGVANAQRSLDYIRTIAEFISQPEYVNIVQIFSPVNEALLGDIGIDSLSRL